MLRSAHSAVLVVLSVGWRGAAHGLRRAPSVGAVALAAIVIAACAPEEGTGGTTATGGSTTGGGGVIGSGGQTGSGGATGSGGLTGSGGAMGNGGLTGSGGFSPTGGQMGTGGSAGRGSIGGVGGGGSGGRAGAGGGGAGGRGGSAGGGGNGTGGGGGASFAPCPAAGTKCAIMPFGDSITDGVGSSGGGYRVELFRLAVTGAKGITFVGRNVNGPTTVAGQPFPRNHEGWSGYTIAGISSSLADMAITLAKPHIITLMIGTNDVNQGMDNGAPNRLGTLLDTITTDAPNALLVVAKMVPTTNDGTNGRVRTYNDAIPGLVQSRVASGKHILMVDMYGAFTANTSYKTALMNDVLHPNDAGYVVMAQTWFNAIQGYLR